MPAAQRTWDMGLLTLVVCLVFTAACTPDRPSRPPAELVERLQRLNQDNTALVDRVGERMQALLSGELDKQNTPYVDILVLSGGADWGAFGAGFLNAWSGLPPEHPLTMPRFDVVTGVSTGALIAPYAYLREYQRADDLYRGSTPVWSNRSLVFGLFTGHGFYDISLLEELIRADLDQHLRRRLYETRGSGRSLLVATTDLDLGMLRLWDLLDEAGDAERLFAVQRAAIAVPAAFDPVLLDGNLHADAGVLMQLFVAPQPRQLRRLLEAWRRSHPGTVPHVRYWVIINNRVHEPPSTVQPSWHDTLSRSMAMMLKSGVLAPLRMLWLQVEQLRAEGFAAELRWVSIPADFPIDQTLPMFDPRTTIALSDLGRRMALSGTAWRSDVPSYTWREFEDGADVPPVEAPAPP
ncbi:MAG: patatin-like phospholipase family protein [Planctomycetes bacterium]|nr:patatin-like phospholipase family protein [Planctomycetota bacterium]